MMDSQILLESNPHSVGISDTALPESRVHGVSLTSWGNRYQAQVIRQGQRYYLGTFATEAQAVDAIATLDLHLKEIRHA